MDAKGLMIGNYLKKDGIVVRIDARSIFDMFENNEKYRPILLDGLWLQRLGFTKGTDMWDDRAEYEYLFSEGKGVTISDTNEIYMGCFSQTLKYVHELQNLIFAMSGVDLQLSST